MLHVVATIKLKPGKRDAFLAEFHKLVPQVLAEVGCIAYGPTVDFASGLAVQPPVREDVVTVVEQWADNAALTAHLAAPHMTAYREKVKDMLVGLSLQVLRPA